MCGAVDCVVGVQADEQMTDSPERPTKSRVMSAKVRQNSPSSLSHACVPPS